MYAPLLRKHKHLLKTSSSFQAHSIIRPWQFAKALTSIYFARPDLVSLHVICILGCLLCFAYLLCSWLPLVFCISLVLLAASCVLHISCALGSISCFSASVIAYSWDWAWLLSFRLFICCFLFSVLYCLCIARRQYFWSLG